MRNSALYVNMCKTKDTGQLWGLSAFSLKDSTISLLKLQFKLLAFFWDCTGQFISDLEEKTKTDFLKVWLHWINKQVVNHCMYHIYLVKTTAVNAHASKQDSFNLASFSYVFK